MIVMVAEAIEVVSAEAEVIVSVAIVRRSEAVVAAIVVVATVVHNGQQ